MKEKISQLEEEVSRLQQQSKSYSDTAIQTVPEEEVQRRDIAVIEANICQSEEEEDEKEEAKVPLPQQHESYIDTAVHTKELGLLPVSDFDWTGVVLISTTYVLLFLIRLARKL